MMGYGRKDSNGEMNMELKLMITVFKELMF